MDEVLASAFTRIPIYDEEPDNIIGIIHTKDVLRAVMASRGDLSQIDLPGGVRSGLRDAEAVLCRIERRPPRLDMSVYPYLPHASVALTSARTYMDLLSGVTS